MKEILGIPWHISHGEHLYREGKGGKFMEIMVLVPYAAAWVIFRLYWIISGRPGKRKPFVLDITQGNTLRLTTTMGVIILLVLGFFFTPSSVVHDPIVRILATAVMLLGFSIAIWAKVHLGVNWSIPTAKVQGGELITTGPYRFFRHPIYTGIWIAMTGTALATNWHLLIISLAYGVEFAYYAYLEERALTEEFPTAYPAYQAKTKMLNPHFW